MRVYELTEIEYASIAMQTTIANESTTDSRVILHGTHSQRGEIVLLQIGQAHFLIEAEETGSPLGQLLTELERI